MMQQQPQYQQKPQFQQTPQFQQQPGMSQQQPGMMHQGQQPMGTMGGMDQMGSWLGSAGAAAVAAGVGGGGGFNDAMAGVVASQMQEQLKHSGFNRWFPAIQGGLQLRFNVGHAYVLRKLLLLLCPFVKRNQGAPTQAWGGDDSTGSGSHGTGPDGMKVDTEDPDLYIPLMSYVTYVLVYGTQRLLLGDFRPELLSATASFALVMLILEVGVSKLGFYVAGSSVPMLDIVANCGYKFAPLALMVMCRIAVGASHIYYVFFAYLAACAAFAQRRFMLHIEPSQMNTQYGIGLSKLHTHVILGLALVQVPLCWLLTPYSSS